MSVTALRKPKAAPSAPTLGSLIESLAINRDRQRVITAEEKLLSAEKEEIEVALLVMLDAQGTDRTATAHYSASITIADKFSAPKEDGKWDIFMEKFVAKNKLWHLVQARISDPGMREQCEIKGFTDAQLEKLGITRFAKRSISLRKL